MTRKRVNQESQDEGGQSGYGYQGGEGGGGYQAEGRFPAKRRFEGGDMGGRGGRGRGGRGAGGFRGGRGGGRGGRREFGENDFAKKYGYVGDAKEEGGDGGYNGGGDLGEEQGGGAAGAGGGEKGERGSFPGELVSYLKGIKNMAEDGESADEGMQDIAIQRAVEECKGEEETLLMFQESCRIVESLFGSSPVGSLAFLSALSRIKHKKLLDLMFSGCAAKTLEKLIYGLAPITKNQHIEVLSKLLDVVLESFGDVVASPQASFMLRAIARVCAGLPPKQQPRKGQYLEPDNSVPSFSSGEMQKELSRLFDRITQMTLDITYMKDLMDCAVPSFVMQDVLEADGLAKGGRADAFLAKAVEMAEKQPEWLVSSWRGRNSSRVWEKAVQAAKEDTRQRLWMGGVADKAKELAEDRSANFVLQKFIQSCKTLEMATDIVDELGEMLPQLIDNDRMGVVISLVKCVSRHDDLQEQLIKTLRKHFNASKQSNKHLFLLNVLTLNNHVEGDFQLDRAQLQGGLLLQALCGVKKTKTLAACLDALTADQVVALATNRVASHVIESVLSSETVEAETKTNLINKFQGQWESLITHPSGSHVWEKIWASVDVAKKQDLMKEFVPIHNPTKFWKFAMLKCDMMLFRKDRKAWVEKWNPKAKGDKGKKKHYPMHKKH